MFILLAVQTVAAPISAPPAPPPPPVISTPVPMAQLVQRGEIQPPLQLSDIDVVLRAPSGPLWQGTIRVADRGGESSWSQTRSEPPRAECPTRSCFWGGEREMLSLSLSSMPRDAQGSITLQVRWARRGDAACSGLKTVELRQTVVVTDRQTTTVSADGGLRVELRRR